MASLSQIVGEVPHGFEKSVHYSPASDTLEILIKDTDFVAVRVDDVLTAYEVRGTREVVGILLKGVQELMQKAESEFDIVIEPGGNTRAASVVLAYFGVEPPENPMLLAAWRQLMAVSRDVSIPLRASA